KRTISGALSLGFALGLPIAATAQVGPGLSSGSGEGTGTGFSSGVQRNRSGSVSGVGPGSASGVVGGRGGAPRGPLPGAAPGLSVPYGPGVETRFPDDTTLFPFAMSPEGAGAYPSELAQIQPREYAFARRIADPGDRTLTLQRLANVAVFSNQLPLAHEA